MSSQSTDPKPVLPPRNPDLTGLLFGRLTVMEFAGFTYSGIYRHATWRCLCSCGTEKVVRAQPLRSGRTTSCGCFQRESIGARRRTHGMFRTPEYAVWQNMKKRCFDTSYRRYPGYGGRGITVCERWRDSFENFIADMGKRPSPKHSIERKNNEGNYEPGNCCWAVRLVQDRNKRTNHLVTFNGETLTLQAWQERTGICYETIRSRLAKGWSAERALTVPGKKDFRDS